MRELTIDYYWTKAPKKFNLKKQSKNDFHVCIIEQNIIIFWSFKLLRT